MNSSRLRTAICLLALGPGAAAAAETVVYKCPGPPVLYTDALTPGEARSRGCKPVEAAPITIIQSPKPRPGTAARGDAAPASDTRVGSSEQRARDSDARRILEAELARSQERLAALQRDYKNGEPDRLGNEQNYQKYLDRVADMKAAIARTQADIDAIKRELAKLPS